MDAEAFAKPKVPEPCCFVLFGVTGDLSHRLVIPALYNLAEVGLLPKEFCVVGVVRKETSGEVLRKNLMTALKQHATRPVNQSVADRLFDCITSVCADPDKPDTFDDLKVHLDRLARRGIRNHLYYLAVSPDAFKPISEALANVGLLKEKEGTWRRVVVEKPFGTDLASAKALNHDLLTLVEESQLYRIDHYLGKETVQNILVLRFANGLFEPIWNRNHIDHVQITATEILDVGHRGSFYDATGALRDMVSNHLFQLLSLVAMEPPSRFDAHSVRSEKGEVLAAIQIQTEKEALHNSVRAQYRAGRVGDRDVGDYRTVQNVDPHSMTETYVAMKVGIDNWRWVGVPFYLRTGKALAAKRTEVAIQFKRAPFSMFRGTEIESFSQNDLVIGVEPTEGVTLQFNTKVPGPHVVIGDVEMRFRYKDYFKVAPSTGYETLIYDCLIGDNILFQRADGVEAGWQAVQPFLNAWRNAGRTGICEYIAGAEGPSSADDLIQRDGRRWRSIKNG
jgi:glucose-6-phosphate 1-dehydrogenase